MQYSAPSGNLQGTVSRGETGDVVRGDQEDQSKADTS